ncbi:MAG: tyrosine-type recombinase/integrase, partial [bacterium]
MRVFKRGKTWYLDYLHKGRRIRKAVGHSKRMAELALKDIEVKIAKDENLGVQELPRVLFRDCAAEYLDYSKAHKARTSSERDALSLNWLTATFGDQYLSTITRRRIEQYMRERIEKGTVKGATVNRELACVRHMLNKAVEWGYLNENPAKGIKMFKESPGRVRFLEPAEIDKLLKECPPYLKPIVTTALDTGLRQSEILSLRWANVNLRTRTIMVLRTKNNEPRFVPINQTLYAQLKRMHARSRADFVFCDKNGKPYGKVY